MYVSEADHSLATSAGTGDVYLNVTEGMDWDNYNYSM